LSFLFCPLWYKPRVATKLWTVALNIFRPQYCSFFLASFWSPKILSSSIDFFRNLCTPEISWFQSS
jgi:hypothetical protein